ncbi:BAR domain-containing protein [Xylariaceae sp. FL1019]|nr:BAR domain-containing protein [Xylariaceae sp. FL1019]
MSLNSVKKSLGRAPQQFKAKFNIGEHTKDAVFIDSERRFQELENETKRLRDESQKYFNAINGMLNHQIEFSKGIAEIYKPISGRVSDPDSIEVQGNPEGIRACEEYEVVVKDLQSTIAPELDMIDTRIVRPANELMDVLKVIRKTAVKRDHKQLDYDRHRMTLKKLKEKTNKDDKAIWKAEATLETSTQEFNYFNDLLKEELPKLFALERQFIQPLFQSFYYMQLNIFYTLHEKMQQCDIGYFNLQLDIEEAFEAKRGDIQEQAEKLAIVRYKTKPIRPQKYGKPVAAIEDGTSKPAGLLTEGHASSPSPSASYNYGQQSAYEPPSSSSPGPAASKFGQPPHFEAPATENPPPPYSAGAAHNPALAAAAAGKPKPPPPKPKPGRLSGAPHAETVTALYDYSAQADGDLSFRAGDIIEIVTRTQNENEWWTGKIGGRQGQFPGNYVKLG